MYIHKLSITNTGPFGMIEFEFDPQVNVFVGPNNSGKSSALWVLGDTMVYPFEMPAKLLHQGKTSTFHIELARAGSVNVSYRGNLPVWGDNEHWNKKRRAESLNHIKSVGYSKFIPALRQSTDFRSPGPVTAKTIAEEAHFHSSNVHRSQSTHEWFTHERQREQEKDPDLRRRLSLASGDASVIRDEIVLQKIIELDYRSYLKKNPAFRNVVTLVGELTTKITEGFPVKFIGADEDEDGFYVQFGTIDGPVPLNTLSQGTQSIVQWLAHLLIGFAEYYEYPDDLVNKSGILIIDEIDAHLHPSWQRRIIPTLVDHFPNLQIFCSTHSPLVVSGLKAGQVQLLQRDERDQVTVSRNDGDIVGWTVDEVLRHLLGVQHLTDEKTAVDLARLQELQLKQNLSPKEIVEKEKLSHSVNQSLKQGPMSMQLEHFADVLREVMLSTTQS